MCDCWILETWLQTKENFSLYMILSFNGYLWLVSHAWENTLSYVLCCCLFILPQGGFYIKCEYKIALDCHLLHQELQCLRNYVHSLPAPCSEPWEFLSSKVNSVIDAGCYGIRTLLSRPILPFILILWFQHHVLWECSWWIVEPMAILIALFSKHQSHGWVFSLVTHSAYVLSEAFTQECAPSSFTRASFPGTTLRRASILGLMLPCSS